MILMSCHRALLLQLSIQHNVTVQ